MRCVFNKRVLLVASDIDGTALKSGNALSPELIHEIQRLEQEGVAFTFATGRLPYEMEMLYENIPWKVPYVAANGAILKARTGYCFCKTFVPNHLRSIAEKYADFGVTVIFSLPGFEHPLQKTTWSKANEQQFPGMDTCVDNTIWETEIDRMFFYHPDGLYLEECRHELEDFASAYSIVFQNRKSIQISAAGCTKGTGILALSKAAGIPAPNILCVGDSDNDVDMFAIAGMRATVSNGTEELKAMADYISEKPYGEGLTDILRRIDHGFWTV